jgi:hypothetical protein
MGEKAREALKLLFDKRLRLEFHGSTITSDAGLLVCREFDQTLGLTGMVPSYLLETRGGNNLRHELAPLLRQSVYSRLAGYEDTNDAVRLAKDPIICAVVGRRALEKQAAGTSVLNRFETEVLVTEENIRGLGQLNAEWVSQVMMRTKHKRVILDMDSSESPVYGEQEGAAYNGHFGCVCYHPLFVFNQFGDCEGAMLRPGNVHSAEGWRLLLEPISARYDRRGIRKYFRGDAAFANPGVYEYLERHSFFYAIRLPSNEVLQRQIQHLLKRPVGRPPKKPVVWYHSFQYQAESWERPRRVVAKVEWHPGELLPRVGFIVTNMTARAKGIVHFYNGRGTAEQWIKAGKYALNWTRLSCHKFVANQVRLQLFILAYNLGNFVRRLGLPKAVKDWSLHSLQLNLIKTGGRMVRHARYMVFQLAEAAAPKELFAAILDRVDKLRPAPA